MCALCVEGAVEQLPWCICEGWCAGLCLCVQQALLMASWGWLAQLYLVARQAVGLYSMA
jgi:hypothetical protein